MKDKSNIPDRWAYRREYAQRHYPPGTRICLLEMPDDPNPVPVGTCGTVLAVDGAGQLLMSLIPGVDNFEVLERPRHRDAPARANRSKGEAR